MNKVILIGNLTKDPELSTTNNGIKFCKFSLAVPRNYSQNGKREVDFLNVIVWRNQAENCAKYLDKGSKCAVVGELQIRSYNANDGTRKYITEIIASEVEFLGGKNKEKQQCEFEELQPLDEDLPF